MSTERDTHFQGFAKLLWEDIEDVLPDKVFAVLFDANEIYDVETRAIQIIAQHAYDLEQHILQHVNWYDPEESDIPDMTEWPK